MRAVLLAALGGGLGAGLRLVLALAVAMGAGDAFLMGTLAANLLGSALIGALSTRALSAHARAFWMTGFCGGLTTFSLLAVEVLVLALRGDWALAVAYLAVSVVGSVLAVKLGRRV